VRLLPDAPSSPPPCEARLLELEGVHRQYDLYLWLSHRMPWAFVDAELAEARRELVSLCIAEGLQLLGLKGKVCNTA
jgi:hypothetical protein